MGIESDQVVYEYLSRVGDVAQQRQLSSATRMRLVAELRNEIDRRRAKAAVDSPAAVRRILDGLGSPDDVVAAAGSGGGPGAAAPAVPAQREPEAEQARSKGLRKVVPRPRPPRTGPVPSDGPSPPHLATADELGGPASRSEWWGVGQGTPAMAEEVPGFMGGVEIPELLKPPPAKEPAQTEPAPEAGAAEPEEAAEPDAPAGRRRFALPPLLTGRSNPLLLFAAVLLVVGAVLGNWYALLFGWVIAYASRRLTPTESKWAVVGMPGLALASWAVWLWGRTDDRWGTPIAEGHMNDAVAQTWPWVVRAAAVLSALFLVWRSQRRK
ncbi:hypothetical protein [Streptomyces sp. CB01373]|uniref:hypothetical protein n=1 Tax=Streptomyces sp. CB01373 TaxID=2020325 RepID=UPI000C276848|nr:hypothetical protein [Streptomyces sp. CB01373]PJM95064.1 hypothetical protein CG719_14200 [Streptomyces sp. CB01373]